MLVGCGSTSPISRRVETGLFVVTTQAALDSLDGVVTIDGTLDLERPASGRPSSIKDLHALRNLVNIAESFGIDDVDSLESLEPLRSLRRVGHDFFIGHNDGLRTLSPLAGLQMVGVALFIQDNDRLKSLDGLQWISTLTATDLQIVRNDSLLTLSGLDNFTAQDIGPRGAPPLLDISENASLRSLAGLDSLLRAGTLTIAENPALTNITALCRLREIADLFIFNNTSLCRSDIEASLDSANVSGRMEIDGNGECDSHRRSSERLQRPGLPARR